MQDDMVTVAVEDAVYCIQHGTELIDNLCPAAAAGEGQFDGVIQRLYIKKKKRGNT
jgi:hypothetical protein